jgi:hypothetical protein
VNKSGGKPWCTVAMQLRRSPRPVTARGWPLVLESPEANNVTSWFWRTSSSVKYETPRSVPPYSLGGAVSNRGDTMAIRKLDLPVVKAFDANQPRP